MSTIGIESVSNEGLPVSIIAVDDEASMFNGISAAIPAKMSVGIQNYVSVKDLATVPPPRADIIIMDMFFDPRFRVDEMFTLIEKNWPDAVVIVLSNYPEEYSQFESRTKVFRFISKVDFAESPKILREAVIDALSQAPLVTRKVRESAVAEIQRGLHELSFEVISELSHGGINYTLSCSMQGCFKDGKYYLEPLGKGFFGSGSDRDAAKIDFVRKFHAAFQAIWSVPEKWRTDEQKAVWEKIGEVVDLEEYDKALTITVVEEVGQVVAIEANGARVLRWHGGQHHDTCDTVNIEDLPRTMLPLQAKAWFVACVERRFLTRELSKIVHGTEILPPIYDEEKRRRLWSGDSSTQEEHPG